jgi:hypothetical protein
VAAGASQAVRVRFAEGRLSKPLTTKVPTAAPLQVRQVPPFTRRLCPVQKSASRLTKYLSAVYRSAGVPSLFTMFLPMFDLDLFFGL